MFRFEELNPPTLPEAEASRIATDVFGVSGELTPLWGERDQNFAVTGDPAGDVVLKISCAGEDPERIDYQTGAMQHIAAAAPDLPIPRIRPARDGQPFAQIAAADGTQHLVHMVSLLPGSGMGAVEKSAARLHAAGKLTGAVAFALRGYYHRAAGAPMFWDIRHLPAYRDSLSAIAEPDLRQDLADCIDHFAQEVMPRLAGLRAQVIHYDATSANMLCDPEDEGRMTGLIDFGDMIHAPLAQDMAIGALEGAGHGADPLPALAAFVRGYDEAYRLEEAEIAILYDLMLARCVLGLLIGAERKRHAIVSVDDFDYSEIYIPTFGRLLTLGRDRVEATVRKACRFPPACPEAPLPEGSRRAETEALLARRHKYLGTALELTYDRPVHLLRGKGVWLTDVEGRQILDCYNNVPHVGHCHPHVVTAISRQAAALNTNTRYLFESVVDYAERLAEILPGDLGATVFVNSGSEATDLALRMARACSGHSGVIIMQNAYHGTTTETHAISPSNDAGRGRVPPAETRPDIEALESPDTYRGRVRDPAAAAEAYAADADRAIAALEARGHPVAAFIIDTALSSSGILDLPDGYCAAVAEKVRAAGGLIISDEVQYGFGRSGRAFWGCQSLGFEADIVTLGKPIANGLAIGAVAVSPDLLARFTQANSFFSTFGGNPVACAGANAVLDVIEREGLMENARRSGSYLLERLRALSQEIPGMGDVRGHGLFLGVDFVTDKESREPDATLLAKAKNGLRARGVLVSSDGIHGNVMKIRPPMVFQPEHADILVERMRDALLA